MKTGHISLLSMILILILFACEKEEADYRLQFTGDYQFHVGIYSWEYGNPMSYDTVYLEHNGFIRYMEHGDEGLDIYYDTDSLQKDSSLFVNFLENSNMTTEISPDGMLVPRYGFHYGSFGDFPHPDTIHFSIVGLGGLGGGWSYEVRGIRH